ncbi:uncharacterized protein LOC129737904 [Uranotaenia lowii]|uniref:uncharacterized protein LOC129737904 n=1 Tax=Uranotaenia lowii TaxID=190385 RepID=UPI00247B069C|nr:uncharacterized protein LOC129737904 [Uranotaenia lowii]
MTNLGDVKHFLGIDIRRENGSYSLCQQKFGLENAKPSKIPLDPAHLQQKEEEEDDRLPNNRNFLSLIGGLLYVSVHSRPDVSASVSILAQKSSRPTQRDWQEAKRVLRYLIGTSSHRLHLGATQTGLEMYADADWAGNHRDRKSNSGFLIRFGGGVVSWGSRRQTWVSLSTTEAEFIALTEGCQELTWVKKLVTCSKVTIGIGGEVPSSEMVIVPPVPACPELRSSVAAPGGHRITNCSGNCTHYSACSFAHRPTD